MVVTFRVKWIYHSSVQVCMSICDICVMCVHIYIYIYVCVCVYVCIYIYVCVCVCVCVYVTGNP